MTNTSYMRIFITTIVLVALMFAACTYVVAPQNVIAPPPTTSSFDSTKRVAVIECWMGHTCISPSHADSILNSIESLYDSSFIAISIHDGYFAMTPPAAMPPCGVGFPNAFMQDFQCATGVDYSAHFPMGPAAPVTGLVNRKHLGTGNEYTYTSTWQQHVDTVVNSNAVASMHFLSWYNATTRAVTFQLNGTWLQTYSGTINMAVMLTEDSLTGWQTTGTTCDSQYVFNHVLRECVNTPGSITGTLLFNGTTTVGSTYLFSSASPYTLPLSFNAAHCNLVALMYDVNTGDVLQASRTVVQ